MTTQFSAAASVGLFAAAVFLGGMLGVFTAHADANAPNPALACLNSNQPGECGWFWGYIPEDEVVVEPEEEEETPPDEIVIDVVVPLEVDCQDPEQWNASCGFVDPDGDFDFQSKQRDVLLQQAVMTPNDPESVAAFQRYMRWAVDQALVMSRMWEWNQWQDQELNPLVHSPVSSFGLRAASRVRQGQRNEVIDEIKAQGGFLVWFTRESCPFCHDMQRAMRDIQRETGLEIYNAPLDGECMPIFEGLDSLCENTGLTIEAARHLGIQAVPDLWLHLPEDDLWFRISSGVEASRRIVARLEVFFGGIQRAAEQGIEATSGQSPAVDFSTPDLLQRASGGLGAGIPMEEMKP